MGLMGLAALLMSCNNPNVETLTNTMYFVNEEKKFNYRDEEIGLTPATYMFLTDKNNNLEEYAVITGEIVYDNGQISGNLKDCASVQSEALYCRNPRKISAEESFKLKALYSALFTQHQVYLYLSPLRKQN